MEFISVKRFKGACLCGLANIAATTEAVLEDGVIWVEGYPICYETSENAHLHFARNDDGKGLERGRLTREIQRKLKRRNGAWGKVWKDTLCRKYKRQDHPDHWLWNHDFYNAPIEDLQYILHLIR